MTIRSKSSITNLQKIHKELPTFIQIWFGNPAAKVFEEEANLIGTTYFTRSYVRLFCSILLPPNPTRTVVLQYTLLR